MQFSSADELKVYAQQTGRQYVSLSLNHSGKDLGQLLIELYSDICPKVGVALRLPSRTCLGQLHSRAHTPSVSGACATSAACQGRRASASAGPPA